LGHFFFAARQSISNKPQKLAHSENIAVQPWRSRFLFRAGGCPSAGLTDIPGAVLSPHALLEWLTQPGPALPETCFARGAGGGLVQPEKHCGAG
jgi:hypothetical protein